MSSCKSWFTYWSILISLNSYLTCLLMLWITSLFSISFASTIRRAYFRSLFISISYFFSTAISAFIFAWTRYSSLRLPIRWVNVLFSSWCFLILAFRTVTSLWRWVMRWSWAATCLRRVSSTCLFNLGTSLCLRPFRYSYSDLVLFF